jgi:hypothetical protein
LFRCTFRAVGTPRSPKPRLLRVRIGRELLAHGTYLDPSALAGHQGVEQVEVDLLAGEDGRPPERRPATHRESRSGPRAGLVHLPARLVEVVQVPEEPVALLGVRGRILVENFGHSSRVYSAARVIRWRTS